jgi:hypothetical protein
MYIKEKEKIVAVVAQATVQEVYSSSRLLADGVTVRGNVTVCTHL